MVYLLTASYLRVSSVRTETLDKHNDAWLHFVEPSTLRVFLYQPLPVYRVLYSAHNTENVKEFRVIASGKFASTGR
jgi:hypothetical protein